MTTRSVIAFLFLSAVIVGCRAETETRTKPQAETSVLATKTAPVMCRLFFQDHKTKQLRWADVRAGETPALDEPILVDDFPKLDAEEQRLVQMEATGGTLMVGVRDNDHGDHQSGWVLLSTGVIEEGHGDHAHWRYESPGLAASLLNETQGNPAHLYLYQGVYYLANDRLNGYSRLDPAVLDPAGDPPVTASFHQGGGNHITLAVMENTVGYGTWIDGGGPDSGRVDVTRIKRTGNHEIAYSFKLPTGNIHGATVAADKVFFAPADGVCWVTADLKPEEHTGEVSVQHISLGKNPETGKPLRTGAFTTDRDTVLFVSGNEDFATLNMLDASVEDPVLTQVQLPMNPGHSPTVPQVVKTAWGKRLAFVFHDRKGEGDGEEHLSLIDLDPNLDLNFQDAKLLKTIPVGRSAVEGHYGHHEISFEQTGKYAFYTNPGDGSISSLSLNDFQVVTTSQVGGKPTKLIVLGAVNHTH